MKKYFLLIFLLLPFLGVAQSFSINTDGSTAHPSAALDIKSNDKGILVPRMSKAQKNTITAPATGLIIFQDAPDSLGFYFYNGSSWLWLATANNITGWSTTGNAGTDTAVHFIGTTDNMPLRFKQNNAWMGQLSSNQHNYFLGAGAGESVTGGLYNTGLGDSVLNRNTTGEYNAAFGYYALKKNTTGIRNTAIGHYALFNNADGFDNVGIGGSALFNLVFGRDNIAIGSGAGNGNDTLNGTVCIGTAAGGFNQRDRIVAIGYGALFGNGLGSSNPNEGKENTAIGFNSMFQARTGSRNTSLGYYAMHGNTTFPISGNNNIAIGDST
ncbi:MAG: hypothetical protein JNM68_01560, partial [Dinghuibacter sp.]|nr:hypothetical protein [Dinghuibacter sp.]